MDSLLATYASSSDDEEEQQQNSSSNITSKSETLKPSSFNFIENPKKTSSLFSALPKPKSSLPPPKISTSISSSDPKPKKVIQFKLPLRPVDDDDDDEDEENPKKPRQESTSSTETSSIKSFFSSLPAPKNSLGLGSGQSLGGGSGRRSIVETDVVKSTSNEIREEKNEIRAEKNELSTEQDFVHYEGNLVNGSFSATSKSLVSNDDSSNWYQNNESCDNYPNYGNYEANHVENNGNYERNFVGNYGGSYGHSDGSATMAAMTMAPEGFNNVTKLQGKRGRNEIPTDIIEVNQDELMKNRPREDQAKSTGIAFGPAYQPASTKGKPSKLHKRKHQIGALYFDMKQREMELTERRSKGFLTKAETQAKYGW